MRQDSVDVAPRTGDEELGLPARLGRNVMATYAGTAVAALAALVVTPFLLGHLGPAGFGLWSLVITSTGFLNLSSMGIADVTTKLVAETAGRDEDATVTVINTNFFALCGLALVAAGLGVGLSLLAPDVFRVAAAHRSETTDAFLIVSLEVALSLPVGVCFGVMSGFQRYDLIGIWNAVSTAAVGLGSIAAVTTGGGLVELAVVNSLANLLSMVLPVVWAKRLVPSLRIHPRRVDRRSVRRTTSLSIWYVVQGLSGLIGMEIDLVVVGAVIGVKGVALFAVGAKIGQLGYQAVGPLEQVFFPHVSSISVEDSPQARLRAVMVDGTRTVLAIGLPIGMVLLFLSNSVIRAWVGPGYAVSAQVAVIFGASTMVGALGTTAWQVIGGLGRARLSAVIGMIDAAVNLVASVALAKVMGPPGVALGTLIGTAAVNVPLVLLATGHLVAMDWRAWARRALRPHIAPTLVTAAALAVTARLHPPNLPLVVVSVVGGFVLYEAVFLRWGAVPEEKKRIMGMMPKRWSSRPRILVLGALTDPPAVEGDDVVFSLDLCREIDRIYKVYRADELVLSEETYASLALTLEMVSALQGTVRDGMPAMRLVVAAAQSREMMAVRRA